ncbi:hypothetical protein EDB82DRAFT_567426 [Fusarium venenatum]|uniref:uncharacterized protein n=1 Tax=Fusarium venenatum TaxID=56646 RepID=UPI001D8AC2A9|nr:hypothetical protein EDB82DRAFT_567426 [Fusarium venenatum]
MGSSTSLASLLNELVGSVCDLLCNRDIKSLRLTCRALGNKSTLRFDRVFISANPRNVDVLLGVANHNVFRHRVKEIIWDDSVLPEIPRRNSDEPRGYRADENENETNAHATNEDQDDISRGFVHLCKHSMSLTSGRAQDKNKYQGENQVQKQLQSLMPSRDSLAHYQDLLRQQSEVLSSGSDEQAFRHAVQRFPQLTKVTVTPAAHGFLFMPLFQTPMIRALPFGFVYPVIRTWPSDEALGYGSPENCPEGWGNDDERKQWRGFCTVINVLADYADSLQISELVVDNHTLPTGIDYTLFDKPNTEYDSLCKIVARPDFRRIVLSLTTGCRADFDAEDWNIYRNGRISCLLAKAIGLEEVVLKSDYGLNSWSCPIQDSISLFDLFPIEDFFLSLVEGHGNHADMLANIRDKLSWRNRPASQRIKVSISMKLNQYHKGRYVCLDKEVQEYLYGDGPPPFIAQEGRMASLFSYGTGIVYDEFDPSFVVPYETNRRRLGRRVGHFINAA